MLALTTLGAPERRLLRRRRSREVSEAGPEPVPTARATIIRPRPFGTRAEADAWLDSLRRDRDAAAAEVRSAAAVLNRALHAHRLAAADPYTGDVSAERALVARLGFGSGEAVADGRFSRAFEPPREGLRRARRSMAAPEERFAALLGGREAGLAAEALVLRARADLDADRQREAALEARVALEALLAELPAAGGLAELRGAVGEAANSALRGALDPHERKQLAEAVAAMEAALTRRRLTLSRAPPGRLATRPRRRPPA